MHANALRVSSEAVAIYFVAFLEELQSATKLFALMNFTTSARPNEPDMRECRIITQHPGEVVLMNYG